MPRAGDDRAARAADAAEPSGLFTLAIVGRPNVGKSTLFNRLVGKRLALVDDQPGVTRDLREGAARLGDLRFTAIDTAGLEDAADGSLQARMRQLTERAVDEADICLFVIDARAGVTALDESLAEILRRRADHVILAANKAEGRAGEPGALEAYGLGLGEPIRLSAEHGEGMEDLYAALQPIADAFEAALEASAAAAAAAVADEAGAEVDADSEARSGSTPEDAAPSAPAADAGAPDDEGAGRPLQIAIVGRPNAGKSTLVNRILGEDRLLTGPEAGITRDAIGLTVDWEGRAFKIFDTAGLRKKAKVQAKLEKLSVGDALRAVRFAEVVVLLLDVESAFETQDLRIADLAEQEGRAVVIGVNKWDLETHKQRRLAELREKVERLLPQLRGVPLAALSAETGQGLDRLRRAILDAHAAWNIRVSTAKLNRWLAEQAQRHPPPAPSGRRIRLRYMTQAKTRPPTFVLFASRPDALPESYRRFLISGLRDAFGVAGAPIRLIVKASENPYAGRAKKR